MIRGPVLPTMRDSLWSLVSTRLDRLESGLTLALESFECGDAALGSVEGLARDAMGGPVLVMLAVEGDTLLASRALAASQFLQRVGASMAQAVPEASLADGVAGRLVVVGTEGSAALVEQVVALKLHGVMACTLEPFRVAGSERFAVRWMSDRAPVAVDGTCSQEAVTVRDDFVVPDGRRDLWSELRQLSVSIDPAVKFGGDRFSRQVVWNGHLLGTVRTAQGGLVGDAATGVVIDLHDSRDVRRFGDQMLRTFATCAGLGVEPDADDRATQARSATSGSTPSGRLNTDPEAPSRLAATDGDADGEDVVASLRSSIAAAGLSAQERDPRADPAARAGSRDEVSS